MGNATERDTLISALRNLTLSDVQERIDELDAQRAALSVLERSLVARERARRRTAVPRREDSGEATYMIAPATPLIEIRGPVPGGIPEETAELVAALLLAIVDEQDAAPEGEVDG